MRCDKGPMEQGPLVVRRGDMVTAQCRRLVRRILGITGLIALLATLTVMAVPAQAATATANDPAVDVFALTETTADSGTVGQSLPVTISATNVTANTMASVRLAA